MCGCQEYFFIFVTKVSNVVTSDLFLLKRHFQYNVQVISQDIMIVPSDAY